MASAGHFLAAAPVQDHAWINAEEQCDSRYNNQADDAAAAALAHRNLESAPSSSRERKSESAAAAIVVAPAFVPAVFDVFAFAATLPSHGNASLFTGNALGASGRGWGSASQRARAAYYSRLRSMSRSS